MDFDAALVAVGDFGLYQKLLCMFLVVPSACFSSLIYFTQFFIIAIPPHWCHVPNNSVVNFTQSREKCLMPDLEFSYNYTNSPCQYGWDYDFTELYPTIATDLNWVCDQDQLSYVSQTIFFIGCSIGVLVFGHIADKYGRRPSILISYSLALTCGILTIFAKDFYTFSLLRFLVGASIIPLSEDPYILSLEYMGVDKRTLPIIFWSGAYIIVSAICPWIAYALHDWQMLCLATTIPLILILLASPIIPESASWLLAKGDKKKTLETLAKVAHINKVDLKNISLESLEFCNPSKEEHSHINFTHVFKTPRMRKHALILGVAWFSTYNCYHVNTQNAANLGNNYYDSYSYSALVEIPSLIIILIGLDWLGRRWPMIVGTFVAGISGVIIMFIPQTPNALLILALIQRVSFTLEYNVLFQYSAEVFPTILRGRAVGFLRFMGTTGLYASPSIVYLYKTDMGLPLLISGIQALFICCISFFLPETAHKKLPQSLKEGENFGQHQKLLRCICLEKPEQINEETVTL